MALYVFSPRNSGDAEPLAAARKAVHAVGGTVVRAIAGLMLVKAPPSAAKRAAATLPGWDYRRDTKSVRVPEHPIYSKKR